MSRRSAAGSATDPSHVICLKSTVGLEMVELVMDCEDEFGISIPDEAAGEVRTVGQFFDRVLALTRSNGKPGLRQRPDLEQYAWDRVRYFCVRPAE